MICILVILLIGLVYYRLVVQSKDNYFNRECSALNSIARTLHSFMIVLLSALIVGVAEEVEDRFDLLRLAALGLEHEVPAVNGHDEAVTDLDELDGSSRSASS